MVNYKNIKFVAIDVDGTLTDGKYIVSGDKGLAKAFYTRDFYAIQQLLENEIEVIIITQSHDEIIQNQLHRIAEHSELWEQAIIEGKLMLFLSCENKKNRLDQYLEERGMGWQNIAYIGDSENDIECLEASALNAVPKDAIGAMDDIDYWCDSCGGNGAVYEFIMHIMEKKGLR